MTALNFETAATPSWIRTLGLRPTRRPARPPKVDHEVLRRKQDEWNEWNRKRQAEYRKS